MRTAVLLTLLLAPVAAGQDSPLQVDPRPVTTLAFGSCNKPDRAQPLWPWILAAKPQVWIWTGDIVYVDRPDKARYEALYALQKKRPGYVSVRKACRVLGTWDDHDYGSKDGGKEFAAKAIAQKALLDFLDEPADSPRRTREGIYDAYLFGPKGKQIAVILLDCRYHRDAPGPDGDMLGAAQWAWLKAVLKASPARLNVVVSGIQVVPQDHRWEKWANFPKARQRLFSLIGETKARGVVFVSGDRHIGEISRIPRSAAGYPLYDVTSSGLTHAYTSFKSERNRWRMGGEVVAALNFGTIGVDWTAGVATLRVHGTDGVRLEQKVPLAALEKK